jgi:hypothetical protein
MSQANEKSENEVIGYAWNFLADLGNGRQFSLSGNFPKGLGAAAMNAEVDKVRSVFDRQQAQSASRGAEQEIEQLKLRRDAAIEDMLRINEKYTAKGHMSTAEKQQKEAAEVHLDKMNKDIAYKQGVLDKLQQEAK